MAKVVLVLSEVDDVEVPVRKIAEGGKAAILEDKHLDTLVFLKMLFDVSCKLVDLDFTQVHLLNLILFQTQLF